MILSNFFAVLSGIALVGGGVLKWLDDDESYLWYGVIGMVISLIACGVAGHSGL